jgi:hypothetical protein
LRPSPGAAVAHGEPRLRTQPPAQRTREVRSDLGRQLDTSDWYGGQKSVATAWASNARHPRAVLRSSPNAVLHGRRQGEWSSSLARCRVGGPWHGNWMSERRRDYGPVQLATRLSLSRWQVERALAAGQPSMMAIRTSLAWPQSRTAAPPWPSGRQRWRTALRVSRASTPSRSASTRTSNPTGTWRRTSTSASAKRHDVAPARLTDPPPGHPIGGRAVGPAPDRG